jgi:hypothetical protein
MARFDRFAKPARRAVFLAEMEKIVPWLRQCALVEPVYPKERSGAGRPPVGLGRMPRIYFRSTGLTYRTDAWAGRTGFVNRSLNTSPFRLNRSDITTPPVPTSIVRVVVSLVVTEPPVQGVPIVMIPSHVVVRGVGRPK